MVARKIRIDTLKISMNLPEPPQGTCLRRSGLRFIKLMRLEGSTSRLRRLAEFLDKDMLELSAMLFSIDPLPPPNKFVDLFCIGFFTIYLTSSLLLVVSVPDF